MYNLIEKCLEIGRGNMDNITLGNISDRKQMEEALNQREQYRILVMSESIMAYAVNISKDLIEQEIYQISDDEMQPVLKHFGLPIPASFAEMNRIVAEKYVDPEDVAAYSQLYQRQYLLEAFERDEKKHILEYRAVMLDGTVRFLRSVIVLVRNGVTGDILAYITDRDITEQKEREEWANRLAKKLSDTKEYAEKISRMMQSGFWSAEFGSDRKHTSVYFSDDFRRLLGFKNEQDFPNKLESWMDRVHPDDLGVANQAIIQLLGESEQNTEYDAEYRIQSKSGEYRWFRAKGELVRDAEMRPIRFVGAFYDINEEKIHKILLEEKREAYEETARLKARLDFEMENMKRFHEIIHSGMWTIDFDKEGRIDQVIWSDEIRKQLGFENEEDFPNELFSWTKRIHPNHRYRVLSSFYSTIDDQAGRVSFEHEFQMRAKDNSYRWLQVAAKIARSPEGRPIKLLGTCIDITQQKQYDEMMRERIMSMEEMERLNAALQEALAQAQLANQSKTKFLFNMSHDIRTPMNAILGFSDMAEKYIDDKDRALDSLKKVKVAGEHLLRLINDVLDMARIESGKVELDPQPCRIPTILENTKAIFGQEMKEKDIDFTVFWEMENEIAYLDQLRIDQIELNLISNALKYTPNGGKVAYSVTQIGAAEDGIATYRISVKDTGIGMSEEFVKNVFGAFERERTSTVDKIQGTGLGLSIVKALVEQMGGTITCESELGVGTEFVIILSFRIGEEKDLKRDNEYIDTDSDFTGKRILLVEDNELNREIAHDILMEYGFDVDTVEDGVIAVDKVAHSEAGYYDLVLMDIQMPNMDGYEATRRIRALEDKELANVPIVAMTANAFEEDRRDALAAGMNDHLAKPIDLAKLLEVLHKTL